MNLSFGLIIGAPALLGTFGLFRGYVRAVRRQRLAGPILLASGCLLFSLFGLFPLLVVLFPDYSDFLPHLGHFFFTAVSVLVCSVVTFALLLADALTAGRTAGGTASRGVT